MVSTHSVLRFDHVSVTYHVKGKDPVLALKDVHFDIPDEEDGEFVAMIGPSGCGKSTILNIIAGLLRPTTGEAYLMGSPILAPTEQAVTVQQAYTCFPWRTVLGNVEFGLEIQGIQEDQRRAVAMEYLVKVGLGDRAGAYPRELSGGMQQRAAIARALALKRPILLMDEPFGALDAQTRSEMQQELLRLWGAEKNTIFFVTHDISEAVLLADRIIVLSPRPAEVIYDVRVGLPRPRPALIQSESHFIELVQALMHVLKNGKPSPI